MRRYVALAVAVLAACGGDDGGGTPARDGAVNDGKLVDTPMADAPIDAQQFVITATCGSEVVTVATSGSSYSYTPVDQTIAVNDIVKFVMPASHNVAPDTSANTDPGLRVNFNETKCLQFTTTGTFQFKCTPHGFTGSFTVQ